MFLSVARIHAFDYCLRLLSFAHIRVLKRGFFFFIFLYNTKISRMNRFRLDCHISIVLLTKTENRISLKS